MSERQSPAVPCRDHWIQHPQGRIFARVWTANEDHGASGLASPIVLFHDSLGCVELWRDFPAELSIATGRPVVAYDRLGFGKSDPRAERPDLDFVADEARNGFAVLREQLGFTRFIAFGHSVGGGMAVNCAAIHRSDCEALITVAAQAFPEDRTLEGIIAAKAQFEDEAQIRRLERYHGDKARWVLDAWTENWLNPDFADWSLAEVLPRVSCPLLAIHGIHDEYGSIRHPEMIGRLSGGASRVEVLADTCHVPHRERPDTVLKLVSEFIAPPR